MIDYAQKAIDQDPSFAERMKAKKKTRTCVICYRGCERLSTTYLFCCRDLPVEYITKPTRKWFCKSCARKVLSDK